MKTNSPDQAKRPLLVPRVSSAATDFTSRKLSGQPLRVSRLSRRAVSTVHWPAVVSALDDYPQFRSRLVAWCVDLFGL
jgi:hypothetical protein